jgi:hypothetical protein
VQSVFQSKQDVKVSELMSSAAPSSEQGNHWKPEVLNLSWSRLCTLSCATSSGLLTPLVLHDHEMDCLKNALAVDAGSVVDEGEGAKEFNASVMIISPSPA